jgi:hypothetical protein
MRREPGHGHSYDAGAPRQVGYMFAPLLSILPARLFLLERQSSIDKPASKGKLVQAVSSRRVSVHASREAIARWAVPLRRLFITCKNRRSRRLAMDAAVCLPPFARWRIG